jgi:hypothetical protein
MGDLLDWVYNKRGCLHSLDAAARAADELTLQDGWSVKFHCRVKPAFQMKTHAKHIRNDRFPDMIGAIMASESERPQAIERTPGLPSTPDEGTSQGGCPYVTGTVTRYCTLTPFTLTDAEREAIAWAAGQANRERETAADAASRGYRPDGGGDPAEWAKAHNERAATLRGLLERTG